MLGLLFVATFAQSGLLTHSINQWKSQPETRVEDAYKWLFHATLGGEHAVVNETGPRRWLEREWGTLDKPSKKEAEVQPLRPDGSILRINMRPYKARTGNREMLLAVFVASAKRFRGDKREFVREWEGLGTLLRQRSVSHLTQASWLRLDKQMKPLGYPAIHHSKEYEKAYRPAYRVILRELWAG